MKNELITYVSFVDFLLSWLKFAIWMMIMHADECQWCWWCKGGSVSRVGHSSFLSIAATKTRNSWCAAHTWKDKRYERWSITVKFFLLCKFWIQSMRNGFLKIRDLNLRITNLKSSSSINFQHWNKISILFSKADMFEFLRQNHI